MAGSGAYFFFPIIWLQNFVGYWIKVRFSIWENLAHIGPVNNLKRPLQDRPPLVQSYHKSDRGYQLRHQPALPWRSQLDALLRTLSAALSKAS